MYPFAFVLFSFIRGDDLSRLMRYVRDVAQQSERYGFNDQVRNP